MAETTMAENYTELSVEYWEAQVDSWLAQLAEIRNLLTLPDRYDRTALAHCVPQMALAGGNQ
jgi:hypothetical protein